MRHTIHKKILSAILCLGCAFAASAYSPDYYTTQSKLSTGRWIKIKVSTTGMQQITPEQLRAWGFNDPSKVSVFGYGGCVLTGEFSEDHYDDLPAQPVYRTTDGRIIFYGESDVAFRNMSINARAPEIRRNTAADAGYYFVTDAFPGASKAPDKIGNIKNTGRIISYHYSIDVREQEVQNPGQGGYRYFGPDFAEKPKQTFDFTVKNPYSERGIYKDARISFEWGAHLTSASKIGLDFSFPTKNVSNVLLEVPSNSHDYYTTKSGYLTLVPTQKEEKTYSVTFSTPSSSFTFAALDYVSMIYPRDNNLEDIDQMFMALEYVQKNSRIDFTNVSNSRLQLWNVGVPTHPRVYDRIYDSSASIMRIGAEKDYSGFAYVMAFDPDRQMYGVDFAGEVKNQNLHALDTPDMLIITSQKFIEQAEELAAIHKRLQGMDVAVVNQYDIYNEFSSGTPSVMGYRRLAKMFYDRDPEKFKYILLYGPGSYDNRHMKYGDESYLLTYQCESAQFTKNGTSNYSWDNYFGLVGDNFLISNLANTPAEVAVGRIPVFNIEDGRTVNNKILSYLENPPLDFSRRSAIVLGDDKDSNSHLRQAEEICSVIDSHPGYVVTKSYMDLYPTTSDLNGPKEVMIAALNKGAFFMGYCGHGSQAGIAGSLYYRSDVKNNRYDIQPLVFLSTCDAMSYDRNGTGFGESFLSQPDGGAIAIVAACRTVYQELNQLFYRNFTRELFGATPGMRIGDVYLRASNTSRTTRDNTTGGNSEITSNEAANTMCYNLAGDPSLPLYIPQYTVKATSLTGTALSDGSTVTIAPLSKNTVSGSIVDAKGQVKSDFNGTIYINLFDAPLQTSTLGQSDNTPAPVSIEDKHLSSTVTEVVNGQFSSELIVPESTTPGEASRIVFYAVSDDRSEQAAGQFKGVIIEPYDAGKAIPDNAAPVITEFYLEDPTFRDGDIVGRETRLHVKVAADQSGIYIDGPQLGRQASLVLDGNTSYPRAAGALSVDTDGSSTLDYTLTELTPGRHRLQFTVSDNANNTSTRAITFVVAEKTLPGTLAIAESPARTEATISVEGEWADTPTGRIVIEDAAGNTIFSTKREQDVAFPYTWDLKDNSGQTVADGSYHCYAIVKAGRQNGFTAKTPIIVVKPTVNE